MMYVQLMGAVLLVGVLGLACYIIQERATSSKLLVYLLTRDNRLTRKLVKPNAIGLVEVAGRAYVYGPKNVFQVQTQLLRSQRPAILVRVQESIALNPTAPAPLQIFDVTEARPPTMVPSPDDPGVLEVATNDPSNSEILDRVINDQAGASMLKAQKPGQVSLEQLKIIILGGVGIGILVTGGAAYWIVQTLGTGGV